MVKIQRPKKTKLKAFTVEDLDTPMEYEQHIRSNDVLSQQLNWIHQLINLYIEKNGKKPNYIIMSELDFLFLKYYLLEQPRYNIYNSPVQEHTLFGMEIVKAEVPYPILGKK